MKLFITISSVLTLLFVVAVALDLSPFLRGPAPYYPDWRWEYNFVNTYPKIWAPILVGLAIILLFYKVETKKNWITKFEGRILLSFAVLSYLLQFALLYANRAGINGLLSRVINPDVNGYFSTALTIHSVPEFLRTFNSHVLSFSMHAQGHPPLSILFFYFIIDIFKRLSFLHNFVAHISPSTTLINNIWISFYPGEKLAALFSIIFIPFLISLSGFALYYLAKQLYGTKVGLRSFVAFTFIPSVLLFVPINDAFISIFPLISLLLFIKPLKSTHSIIYFLSGFIFSIGIYFSISLIPLVILFIGISINKKQFKNLLYFSCGNLIIPLFLWIFFQFNSIQMFQVLVSGLPEHRAYTTWVFYNLYDFFIFTGIPFAIVFIAMLLKGYRRDVVFTSFTIMILLVNFSGSIRGEVARIWIPYVPFYLMPLINFITLKKFTTYQFIGLLMIQLLIILTLNMYWVTFW